MPTKDTKAKDIRWIQRFNNFKKSLQQLDYAIALIKERELSNLEKQGVIQAFEYNYELAWNVLKDFYENQGEQNIQGSRDAIKLAFKRGLLINGEIWLKMIKSRALTSHTYSETLTEEILDDIIHQYYLEFSTLKSTLESYTLRNE